MSSADVPEESSRRSVQQLENSVGRAQFWCEEPASRGGSVVALSVERIACNREVVGSTSGRKPLCSYLGQVVHAYICFRHKQYNLVLAYNGSNALRQGRLPFWWKVIILPGLLDLLPAALQVDRLKNAISSGVYARVKDLYLLKTAVDANKIYHNSVTFRNATLITCDFEAYSFYLFIYFFIYP